MGDPSTMLFSVNAADLGSTEVSMIPHARTLRVFSVPARALGRARLSTAYVSSAYTAQVGGCF